MALEPSTIRIGRRYRANRLNGPYDAVVIGSGIGGLTVAALLAAQGRRVCVLEQHYTAGGYTHSYDRNGYEWDVGVHYIGDVGTKTMARRLFDFLSAGQLQWAPMDAEYDRFHIGDKTFSAVAGRQAFRDNLVSRFPREARAIDRYLDLLDAVGKAMPLHTLSRMLKPWQRVLATPFLKWKLPDFLGRTTWEVLTELTRDRDLIAVLCGQWGDMGLPPKQSAFLIHALIARHYLYGGYYPVGGSWKIAETIIPQIQAAGGEVFTYARVQRILVEGGRTRGVQMEDGTRIDCGCVISSAGVFNTFERLLAPEVVRRAGYDKLLPTVRHSAAHLGVYIGLKGTAEEFGLPKTNFWVYPHNDYDAATAAFMDSVDYDPAQAPFPVVYISFPSAKDPDYARRRPGTATIEIVAPAPYAWFEKWRDTPWGKRGDDYDAFKARLGEDLMAYLYDKLPQLRGRVDYYEVSTPLSTQYFCEWQRGELYGLDHDPQRFTQDWLAPRTKIPGLWLTGQDIVSCGVVGAMMGGLLTATAIAGPRKMAPVMKRIFAG
jgi:all-trans-retinol 13,14-reductase